MKERELGQVIPKELPNQFGPLLVKIIKDGNDKYKKSFQGGHVHYIRFKSHWWIRFFGRTESEDSKL